MNATLNKPPTRRPSQHPTQPRKVPIADKPRAEKRDQLRHDRISAAVAIILIVVLITALVWIVMTGDASPGDVLWDYPHLY